MKASSKCPRVESSTSASRPPTSSDLTAEEFVDPTVVFKPLASSLGDTSIRSILDTVMAIQAAHGQLLLDVLTKLRALRVDLMSTRGSTPQPPPFDDES